MAAILQDRALTGAGARDFAGAKLPPDGLTPPAAIYLFGSTEWASRMNRAPGRSGSPLTGTPVSVAAGHVVLDAPGNVLDTGIVDTGSFAVAFTVRVPGLPASAPGAAADHVAVCGNYGSPAAGMRLFFQNYQTSPDRLDLVGTIVVDNAGSPLFINTTISGIASPTTHKLVAFSCRAGVDRTVWDWTAGTRTTAAETRARVTGTRAIRIGQAAATEAEYRSGEFVNGLIITGAGWDPNGTEWQLARDMLRADALLKGITV